MRIITEYRRMRIVLITQLDFLLTKKTIKAQIHSPGRFEEGYDNNNFSNGDKWVYYNAGIDGFVTTPDGSLKKYNVRTAKVNVISEDLPSDPKDTERKNQVNPIDVPKIKKIFIYKKNII
ncbi:DUF4329 domain-containing protein [Coprobacter fastidiosus]|uniref:DUF4329 domain-containing protein n=1 Tax=Coprobacter fastidiosus TaxID=1099853 RepID=UPI0022E5AA36|nr:DUF4329 domain-containing protein [Coprobacter fastidiosus]